MKWSKMEILVTDESARGWGFGRAKPYPLFDAERNQATLEATPRGIKRTIYKNGSVLVKFYKVTPKMMKVVADTCKEAKRMNKYCVRIMFDNDDINCPKIACLVQ